MNRTLPHPAKYWRDYSDSRIPASVDRYIHGEELTVRDIALVRAYVMQWVDSPAWEENLSSQATLNLTILRAKVAGARTKEQIDSCVALASAMQMDPL